MPIASLCYITRCITMHMVITRHNLVKTIERLVGANGRQIKLDGALFLNRTLGVATISQLVYMTPQVTCLFLSLNACQELGETPLDSPAQATGTGRVAECTAMDNEDENIQGCDRPAK